MPDLIYSGNVRLSSIDAETGDLVCPRCGSNYLHQGDVTVFDRTEDARQETRVAVSNGGARLDIVETATSGNPSGRRHGMAIRFDCETCSDPDDEDDVIELTLAQHKGYTLVGWRYTPKRR